VSALKSAALSERTADLENALTELSGIKAQLDSITAERDTANESLSAAQSQITALEADLVTANTSAEARAAEIVAQAGIAPVEVSADENLTATNTKTREEFNALNHLERNAFVRNGGKII
jgi:predicted  nucleic acid-binding Zn-ribbon protein